MSSYFTGEFGSVMEGNLKQQDGTSLKVAVKTMKCELPLMKHLPAGVGSWGSNLVFCKASEGVRVSCSQSLMGPEAIQNTVWSQRESDRQELFISSWYILYTQRNYVCYLHHAFLSVLFSLYLPLPSSLT